MVSNHSALFNFIHSGSFSIFFSGFHFGSFSCSPVVSLRQSSKTVSSNFEVSLWLSSSCLFLKLSRIHDAVFSHLFMTVASAQSSYSSLFSYQLGSVVRMHPSSAVGSGGQVVAMFGYGIGALSSSVRCISTGSERSFWISDSSASAKIPVLLKNSMAVMILSAAHRTVSVSLTPASPVVESWSLIESCPTLSPHEMVITGTFFGSYDSSVDIRLAGSSFRNVHWFSDSSISGKPQNVELMSRGIVISVSKAVSSVPLGYVCSNLAQNEPMISLSSQFVADVDVSMKVLFTPFAGIRERGSLIITVGDANFSFIPASPVFVTNSSEMSVMPVGLAYFVYSSRKNLIKIFFLRSFDAGFPLELVIHGVTNPSVPQAEQQNVSASLFGTYGAKARDGGGFLEGRSNGTLPAIRSEVLMEPNIQFSSRLVGDQNVLNIFLAPSQGLPSPGYLVITLCGGFFKLISKASVRVFPGSISSEAKLEDYSNVLRLEFSGGAPISSGTHISIAVPNIQNPVLPQEECRDIHAATLSSSGSILDSMTKGYLPAIYSTIPSIWTAGSIATFLITHQSSFFDATIEMLNSHDLTVLVSERLDAKQSLVRAVINKQGEYLLHVFAIVPGALECQSFASEWFSVVPPVSSWLQSTLSTDVDGEPLQHFNSSFSVRWNGYIYSYESVEVTFFVVTNQKFRIWIGREMLMDQSSSTQDIQVYASTKSMTMYKYENVIIELKRNPKNEDFSFKVQWESSYWAKQSIPSSNMWYVVRHEHTEPVPVKVRNSCAVHKFQYCDGVLLLSPSL
jgi:hypothetical protein